MNYECILGAAGTGKSTLLRERAIDDPNYARVSATTGIAAINLGPGVTTVNSVLGFYNRESAFEALEQGKLRKKFLALAVQGYKNLVIDEVSMMSGCVLTAIRQGAKEGAEEVDRRNQERGTNLQPCGLILTGDFCQLPPVNAPFAFESPEWGHFEENTTRLDKVFRQTDPAFLEGLKLARAGKGTSAVMALAKAGVQWVNDRDDFFDGTSLVPTNDMANKINAVRYAEIKGTERGYQSTRWGAESGEWKDIPESVCMKAGALVMVLANEPQLFEYVNGDQGEVVAMGEHEITVAIQRNQKGHVKDIPFVWRESYQKDKPEGVEAFSGYLIDGEMYLHPSEIEEEYRDCIEMIRASGGGHDSEDSAHKIRNSRHARFFEQHDSYVAGQIKCRKAFWSVDKEKWVIGWITYMPVRLAYASTTHKAQGLTLDKVQIDARSRFAGSPGMMYTAISRCRTPENIRIVCSIGEFARRIQTAQACLRFV